MPHLERGEGKKSLQLLPQKRARHSNRLISLVNCAIVCCVKSSQGPLSFLKLEEKQNPEPLFCLPLLSNESACGPRWCFLTQSFVFFLSLKEFLPASYMKKNKIEKKIFQEHKKLLGTSEIDAKVKYVRLARSLPTFGVHFFLVKVSFKLFIFIKKTCEKKKSFTFLFYIKKKKLAKTPSLSHFFIFNFKKLAKFTKWHFLSVKSIFWDYQSFKFLSETSC